MEKTPTQLLEELAKKAIERLEALPKPIVRVCGPLTSGGFGYDKNLRRFIKAEEKLKAEGNTVFNYFEENDDELVIKEAGIDWNLVMEHYHKPILATGLMSKAYFMPKWETSKGATWEHDYIRDNTDMEIEELPEAWFVNENGA